jgi:eukaryotic-like serine/threonine-protein kinase
VRLGACALSATLAQIPLGPFLLHKLIGAGGAGEVWEGMHTEAGVPVAVKVITAKRARDRRFQEAFQHEVRAVAGLDHPGIVEVFDTGTVNERAEAASSGRMVSGSPYLAMELGQCSLRALPLPRRWKELRSALLWLLDILGHAHASGVIHRDLKPGNVLVFGELAVAGVSSSNLRLTDFGLAHPTVHTGRRIRGTSGTPLFMAPEQFRGDWRDFGPWTDLYALGCMAYALTSGRAPYTGTGATALMREHLVAPMPSLTPRLPVPRHFERWIHRLLQKAPSDRFERAADAAEALLALGEPIDGETWSAAMPLTLDTGPSNNTPRMDLPRPTGDIVAARCDRPLARRLLPAHRDTWRGARRRARSMRLVGAGMGLYGLRKIPLIGREEERDVLWQALGRVHSEGGAQVVVTRGAAGCGKSRLCAEVSERAHEVGAAVVVRVGHSRSGGPSDGLAHMAAVLLGCDGESRAAAGRRLDLWLRRRGHTDAFEWNALLDLIWPLLSDVDTRLGFMGLGPRSERFATVARLLRDVAGVDDAGTPRPLILWVDDMQWGPDVIGLLRYLVDQGDASPRILALATVLDEAPGTVPEVVAAIDALSAHARSRVVPLGPLPKRDHARLVEELLHLEGPVAEQVRARTAGNPLFAVQLVGDWVERGVLEVGKTGFRLRAGELAVVPDDIHALWEERVAGVLAAGDEASLALQAAAMLGTDLDGGEWAEACAAAGFEAPRDLVARLVERRLAVERDGGWAFAHGMLRESLERSAREAGRESALHLACASALHSRYQDARPPGLAERLARHLVAGGEHGPAVEPLLRAAAEHQARSDYLGTLRLLDERDRAMSVVGVSEDDRRVALGQVARASALHGLGRYDEAETVARATAESVARCGFHDLWAPALRIAATAMAKQGRPRDAEPVLLMAMDAARNADDALEHGLAAMFLGEVARRLGRRRQAYTLTHEALDRFAVLGEERAQANAMAALGAIALAGGEADEALLWARRAMPLFEAVGARFGMASVTNTMGDALRALGRLAESEQAYRDAANRLRELGSHEHLIPMLNLGLLLVARGCYAEASDRLETVLDAMSKAGRRGLEGALHAALLPCVAASGGWAAFDHHAKLAGTRLEHSRFVDVDVAEMAERAAELAAGQGEHGRAVAAWRIAEAQWAALGEHSRHEEARSARRVDEVAAQGGVPELNEGAIEPLAKALPNATISPERLRRHGCS